MSPRPARHLNITVDAAANTDLEAAGAGVNTDLEAAGVGVNAAGGGSDNSESSTSEHDTAIGVLAALRVLSFGLIGYLTYQFKRASKDPKHFIGRPASSSASNSNRHSVLNPYASSA